MQQLIFTNEPKAELTRILKALEADKIFVVADRNTCGLLEVDGAQLIVVEPGDEHKTLKTAEKIWSALVDGGATRRSVVVNLGGGMITDLGGFAAATFKRGIRFLNVPTSLLGAVDAAVGGKTGFNFQGLKNEIGVFCEAEAVVISARFFATLPAEELMSGYAEMIKHALIADGEDYLRLISTDPLTLDADEMLELLRRSVEVKRRIVAEDPHEKGLRKALNLGHTAGHAFEELALEKNVPMAHGAAVAHGLLVEMILSHMRLGYPSAELHRYATWLRENYHPLTGLSCEDYPRLLALMAHDKKNEAAGAINFTLLESPGRVRINQIAGSQEITAAFDIYRDL